MQVWVGATVEWVGETATIDGVELTAGTELRVLDPGEHAPRGYGVLTTDDHPGVLGRLLGGQGRRRGITVATEDGHQLTVSPDQVRLVDDHPLRPDADGSAASWWLDDLDGWGGDPQLPVRAFVPRVLPAVAMVLHPWWHRTRSGGEDQVQWSEVVDDLGLRDRRELHEALVDVTYRRRETGVQHVDLSPYDHPEEGFLDRRTADVLVGVLRDATTTPDDVYVGVWQGQGLDAAIVPDAALLPTRHRGHLLLRGPVDGVLTRREPLPGDVVNGIWWPADRAWLVHTDVDLPLTHVGGTQDLVDALLSRPDLEVVQVDHDAAANRVPA